MIPENKIKGKVLVCFAVKEEAASLRKYVRENAFVSVLITGMGQKNAERALRRHLDSFLPEVVFTCGFAGGLSPALQTGALIFETDDENLAVQLLAVRAQRANFFCANRVAITAQEKKALRASTGADAVEMESEVIRSVCSQRGIPCATLRAISDPAHEDLPIDFNQIARADMSLDFGKLAWEIIKSPWKIRPLLALARRGRVASEQLARALQTIIFR